MVSFARVFRTGSAVTVVAVIVAAAIDVEAAHARRNPCTGAKDDVAEDEEDGVEGRDEERENEHVDDEDEDEDDDDDVNDEDEDKDNDATEEDVNEDDEDEEDAEEEEKEEEKEKETEEGGEVDDKAAIEGSK